MTVRGLKRGGTRWLAVSAGVVLILTALVLLGWPKHEPITVTERQAQVALEVALEQVGSPYVWSARGPETFDSSGIIVFAYRQAIPSIRFRVGDGPWPRFSNDANHRDLYSWNIESIVPERLRPGDLVFLTDGTRTVTHGALFVRWIEPHIVMEFVDASSRLMRVAVQQWQVDAVVRGQTFVAAGRLAVNPREDALRHESHGP